MYRRTLFAFLTAACVAALAVACSGLPQPPLSPSANFGGNAALNPDGSSLKVTEPSALSPSGNQVVETIRPTLTFANSLHVHAPTGRFANVALSYEIEVSDQAGTVVYRSPLFSESAGVSSHTVEQDGQYETIYSWRARARLGTDTGPWSAFATFRTFPRPGPPPPPPPPPGGGLPFPIPAECGPFGPGNRIACVAAIAAQSVEWQLCASGRGVGCHRFTRQVVFALAQSDPNWKLIQAAPGGQSCNCFVCGPSDGTFFREDTTVYGGNRVFDMIVGAGGPSPSVSWGEVPGPRPGDIPADAPLCAP